MRLLHTSDWHIGRSLHGTDLLAEQEAVLSGLADVVRAESVNAVLVAGDVYDRAVPSADATAVLDRVLMRLRSAGAAVVLTPGNHDSARRLGFGSGLFALSGVHVRATVAGLDEPVLLADEHGDVAVYGLPFLEPEVARHELGLATGPASGRSHQEVLVAAMSRVRADLFLRPGARSVVLAHAFVGGGMPSDSERDICVGGVDRVAESVFDGVDYVALGHLHRPQTLTPRLRYSGSPLAYSFGEAGQQKQVWLVDLDAHGLAGARPLLLPAPRRLSVLTGTLADLLADPAHDGATGDFVSARLTDPVRPVDPMRQLQRRFPHCVHLEWTGAPAGAESRSYQERMHGRSDLEVTGEFVSHVRGTAVTAAERGLLVRALAAAGRAEDDPMRVHRIELTAFGPFPGPVTVDLDDVGRDGLFLLWGPTGAGKTTLLDAIVFALYGTVPGARGEERRLRSDHADEGTRTEVTCELTLAGERLLVVRRPEQQRPKKRGTGLMTEQAKLTVQRWTGAGWEPVSTRIDEGSEHLRQRIGLSAEQFCQVVLLPQGDFARFLRAEPEDRGRLLRTLFDVDRFARVEDWLAAERSAARQRLEGVRVRASTLIARVAQVADVAVPEELAPELVGVAAPGARAETWVATVRSAAARRLTEAEARAERAGADVGETDAALAAARAARDRHERRDRARLDLARLAAEEAELAPLRAELDAGRRAEPVRDVLEAAGTAGLEAEAAGRVLTAARAAWQTVAAGEPADGLLARALRDEVAALRALLPEVTRAGELDREVRRLARSAEQLAGRCAEQEDALAGWPDRLAAQEQRTAEAAAAAARLPGLTAVVQQCRTTLAAARSAQALAPRVARQRETETRARETWLDAREHWNDLRARRLDGMAAELAAQLTEGAGCPVCGATEHPRPAEPGAERVGQADEAAAREAADAAETRHGTAREELQRLERELAAARAQAGLLSLADQEQAEGAAVAEEAAAAELAAGLAGARTRLAGLVTRREAATAELALTREELGRRRAEAAAAREALDEVRARLAAACGEDADLAGRVRRLTARAERCEALVDAEGAALRARAAEARARRTAAERVAAVGFADLLDAAAALLAPARTAAVGRRVEEHDRARAVVTATLAEPELADLGPRPDVESLVERCRTLTEEREAAVAALEEARRRVVALDALSAELTEVEVELDDQRAETEHVTALADLVAGRGANALRMRLQSFVLAARLEQVAEVASRRLLEMSGGRYTFLHSDAQGRNGARGGLGLDVFDEYTGVRRPTKTLSGGESFMASLALALGLADVVTAESGGVQLDTLFVDEGFGTLDPQALDAVMTVLDDLRRGGRMVGVISHVEELRTRISSRLEVVAGRDGSRLAA